MQRNRNTNDGVAKYKNKGQEEEQEGEDGVSSLNAMSSRESGRKRPKRLERVMSRDVLTSTEGALAKEDDGSA